MALLWSAGAPGEAPNILKTPGVDPALIKAAEKQKTTNATLDSSASGVDVAAAAKVADKFGGKPGDYVGLNHFQLADKLGGKPGDYVGYLTGTPTPTPAPAAPKAETPKAETAIDPGLVKAAAEQARKAAELPPGQTDITVFEAKTPEPAGTKPPTESVKATDSPPAAPVSSIKVAPEGMSTTAALSLGMMPAETAKNLGLEGNTINKADLDKIQQESFEKAVVLKAEMGRDRSLQLADITGLKPSEVLKPDGTINSTAVADALGGKPSDYKTIDDVLKASTLQDSGAIKDRVKEILTFGQATTKTFNEDDLVKEYQTAQAEAAKNGLTMVESQQEYVTRILNSQAKLGEVAGDFAIGLVPGVGTLALWGKMDDGGRALSAGLDILTFIPVAGIASAAVRAGMKTSKGLMTAAIAEAKAPLTTLLNPIKTTKTAVATIEDLVMPKTIPLAAAEVSYHTVRIPTAAVGKGDVAIALREKIMNNAAIGADTKATVSGVTATIPKNAASTVVKPAVWSGTPDVRYFMDGGKVGVIPPKFKGDPLALKGEGKPLFVSNSLHSRFSMATSGGAEIFKTKTDALKAITDIQKINPDLKYKVLKTSEGYEIMNKGAKPGFLLIRDPDVLAKLSKSEQGLYNNSAEIEAIFRRGVDLPKPSQIVFSRAADGTKLTGLVIGDPLSKSELAGLKILGRAEDLTGVFRPRTKASVKVNQMDELLEAKTKARDLKAQAKKNPNDTALAKRAIEAENNARRIAKRMEANPGLLGYASYAGTYSRVNSVFKSKGGSSKARSEAQNKSRPDTRSSRSGDTTTSRGRGGTRGGDRPVFGGGTSRSRTDDDRSRRTGESSRRTVTDDRRVVTDDDRRTVADDRRTVPGDNRTTTTTTNLTPPVIPPAKTTKGKLTTKSDDKSDSRVKMGVGDVAWRQGLWWIVKRKNGETIYTRRPPEGAKRFDGTPKETFFTRGDNPPQDLEHEMGVTEAKIDLTKQPKIEFIENRPPKVVKQSMPRSVRRQLGMR